VRDGHQQFYRCILLKVLWMTARGLRRYDRPPPEVIPRAILKAAEEALNSCRKSIRQRAPEGLPLAGSGARVRRGGKGLREGGRQLFTVETAAVGRRWTKKSEGRKDSQQGRGDAPKSHTEIEIAAQGPHRDRDGRKRMTAEEIFPRLTQAARRRQAEPVIGPRREIRRTIQVIARRNKNNPCCSANQARQDRDRRGSSARISTADVREAERQKSCSRSTWGR